MKDITNQRFGKLIALEPIKIKNKTYWKCKCDCGNICYVKSYNLTNKSTSSCGCLRHNKYHNKRLSTIRYNMKERCFNKNNSSYKNYGARGISICNEWSNSFDSFYDWAIQNGYNDSLTIDRINNNGNYEPNNCRWVNLKIQANNTRRNHIITYNGISKTMAEWADDLCISYTTLRKRLNDGWTIEKAINESLKKFNTRENFDKSFTFEKQDFMYFNTVYGKFKAGDLTKFFNLDRSTFYKYIKYHLDQNATQVLEKYLHKHNKTINELLNYIKKGE